MFVGHYGPSYAGKAGNQQVPLWLLFLAVQFLDVLWGVFVLLGIEKVRIVPGITATNPLDLYYMPYTHGLITSVLWSGVAALLYRAWRGSAAGRSGPIVVGAAVFSHWILDFVVHRPDLPLWADEYKVGLGLWNHPAIAFGLEAAVLFGGLLIYLRSTREAGKAGVAGFVVFSIALLALQAMTFFGAPPSSPTGAAVTALLAYGVIAGTVGWLERKRIAGAPLAAR